MKCSGAHTDTATHALQTPSSHISSPLVMGTTSVLIWSYNVQCGFRLLIFREITIIQKIKPFRHSPLFSPLLNLSSFLQPVLFLSLHCYFCLSIFSLCAYLYFVLSPGTQSGGDDSQVGRPVRDVYPLA